jgi:hypothetical protein
MGTIQNLTSAGFPLLFTFVAVFLSSWLSLIHDSGSPAAYFGEALINSMTTLACGRFRYQGALSQACVDLSRKCNDESGIGPKPLRAGPGAHRCGVDLLAKDYDHRLHRCRRGA